MNNLNPFIYAFKRWTLTISDYTKVELVQLRKKLKKLCSYYILSCNVDEEDRSRIMGFLILKKGMRLGRLRGLVSMRAYFDYADGTNDNNINLIEKAGGKIYEYGHIEPPPEDEE